MKRALAFVTILGLFAPTFSALAFDPNYILSNSDLTNEFSMDINGIQSFLDRGYLGTYKTEDYTGHVRYAADIIWQAAQTYGINPAFLLVLIQKEQSLVDDDEPTQKQLDWAAGYGVCDTCSLSDTSLARWQGFGKQINSAALQFVDGYMADIEASGVTAGKYGPGIPVTIDGTTVVPQNAATAAMYAYTPHLHGNLNFTTIWDRWFGKDYPTGTLLQAAGQDGVWLIEYGYKRPIRSASALHSRFDVSRIISVEESALSRYPTGTPIDFPNYSLLRDEDGRIYLLVNDTLRHIDSMETFRAIGFSEDEVVDITNTDLLLYTIGTPITSATVYPEGKLLQIANGAVFYVEDGIRHAVIDKSILTARFPDARLSATKSVEIEQFKEGAALTLPDGMLVKSPDSPTVYVLSEGKRRPIPSEEAFHGYGYSFDNVVVVPSTVVNLHPLGDALDSSE